jgi:hypothetical protein
VTAVGLVIVALVVLGALSYRSISQARDSLASAHSTISNALGNRAQLDSPAGRVIAQREIDQVLADASKARQILESSSALTVLGKLPLMNTQRDGLLQLVNDVQSTAAAGNQILQEINSLSAHSSGTSVSLPDLQHLRATVASASVTLTEANRPAGSLWGPLGNARRQFDTEDAKLANLLSEGNDVLSYVLPMLGADGPRNYLIAGENNAEMRDQGSVLSLAELNSNNGTFSLGTTQSVGNVTLSAPASVVVPAGTEAMFGSLQPTQLWQSVNATADFPFSGLDMQAMYAQATGTHINGVIALDVPALVSLLQLTGPVSVPGIAVPISASNASDELLHNLYAGFPSGSQTERHDDISAVARAVIDKMKTEHVDLAALAQALANDVAGRHLLVWDENPSYEVTLAKIGASGAIDTVDPQRTFHLAVESATAAKLDYYVTDSVHMDVTINQQNSAIVYTYVTVVNNAPAGQSPSYQLGPDNINTFTPGQYVSRIYLWSPEGSQTSGGISESGLVVNQTPTSVLPQQQQTVMFKTVIPNAVQGGEFRLHLVPQPRLTPANVTVSFGAGPRWRVSGPAKSSALLDKPRNFSWGLTS